MAKLVTKKWETIRQWLYQVFSCLGERKFKNICDTAYKIVDYSNENDCWDFSVPYMQSHLQAIAIYIYGSAIYNLPYDSQLPELQDVESFLKWVKTEVINEIEYCLQSKSKNQLSTFLIQYGLGKKLADILKK